MTDFENVQPGDPIAIVFGIKYDKAQRATVSRVTKTQILAGARRWYRKTGRQVGGHWSIPVCIQPWNAAKHEPLLVRPK